MPNDGYSYSMMTGDPRVFIHDRAGRLVGWRINGAFVASVSEEQTNAMLDQALRKAKDNHKEQQRDRRNSEGTH